MISNWIADHHRAEAAAALAVFDLSGIPSERLRWVAAGFKDDAGDVRDWITACARAGIDRNAATAIYTNANPDARGAGNAGVLRIAAIDLGYHHGPGNAKGSAESHKRDPDAPDGFSMQELESIMGGPIPRDHAQALAYARIAMASLRRFDEYRYEQASLLLLAPDELTELWAEISREATLRARETAQHQRSSTARRLSLAP